MSPDVRSSTPMSSAVDDPHARALAALERPEPDALAAIAWCSAHLAAADCVLYARAERHVRNGRQRVRGARAIDHTLQQALCRLDRRLTGDVHLAEVTVDDLVHELRKRLLLHVDSERRLVQSLEVVLDRGAQEELADRLREATAVAPSRPHPHTRHTRLAPLLARVDAGVDRVRDVMDNRVVPTARPPRTPRRAGRWGCYLMGTPYPEKERSGSP